METRIRSLFLNALWASLMGTASLLPGVVAAEDVYEPIITPDVDRREVKTPKIDTENWEVGVSIGSMTIEDFGTDTAWVARLDYHITESFFVEATYGSTEAGRTSFENLSGGADLLSDDERDYTWYDLSLAWNVFPGEAFFGTRRSFNTAFYLIGGAGNTNFADDNNFTIVWGAGYRVLFTDAFSFRFDVRDHMFDTDLLGEDKTTHNIQIQAGVSMFF